MASRIGTTEWKIAFAVAGFTDLAQVLLGFTGIGLIINEIADIVIGAFLILYFQLRGVSMITHPTRALSLIGVGVLEGFTGGVAPAWFLDVWYIKKTVDGESLPNIQPMTPPRNQKIPLNSKPGIRPPRLSRKI